MNARMLIVTLCLALAATRQGQAACAEPDLQTAIRTASASSTWNDLAGIVRNAAQHCSASMTIGKSLTGWLRENHPIYAGRRPSQVAQFRGFLLASLAAFPPQEELYGYVKSELTFSAHPFNVAAASIAARSFADKSDELAPLMERFLSDTFGDQIVDVTAPTLDDAMDHPTRARYEIIRTVRAYGARGWRFVPLLEQIAKCKDCGAWSADRSLQRQAAEAASYIREVTPPCCQKEAAAAPAPRGLLLIDKQQRKPVNAKSVKLEDQEGRPLTFGDLRGRPFVLTFFYSQCTNQFKCVMTVRRLRELAHACAKDHLENNVGIYGMTYDPHFDTPSILKKYGIAQGLPYGRNVRLLKTADASETTLRDVLDLRVNYGAGTVNQHGIQLFVFDKNGKLAATHDNELWSVTDVKNTLAKLVRE